ncbi:MAG TPA: DUF134 domain-containing protein [Bacteroidales bacterium]|nr:DUF134 domain-containing protein [Bacteroidales bacterium]
MSRPKQCRRIQSPPLMSGFKPFGIPRSLTGEVTLQYDEYEAIRLLDYEGLLQEEAAERMNVSRPTLTRIYAQARKTVAQAFVEGKSLVIEGGNVDFGGKWYRCRRCNKLMEGNSIQQHPCGNRKRHRGRVRGEGFTPII